MARLNDPPISTDSPEILRRKLLRQNRDLAKANSAHLTRIRALEAQNAQLLSEKLELSGRIIELEKEVEDNEARRVADHALDIRAKLEAQLLDCISVLGELGNEPPRKRHASPKSRRTSKSHTVLFRRSPPQKRPRESARDAELRALQEGRLPPIQENKSYPRRTMDREEILALCSEAADTTDTTDSPELGPPPTSRFVDAERQESKLQSPTKSPPAQPQPAADEQSESPSSPRASPFTELQVRPRVGKATHEEPPSQNDDIAASSTKGEDEAVSEPAPRTSSKRKFGASDDSKTKTILSSTDRPKSKTSTGRPTLRIERTTTKASREATSAQNQTSTDRPTAPIAVRVPLAAKSTNEDITSPKKLAASKPPVGEGNLKSGKTGDEARRERRKAKAKESQEPTVTVPVAPPPPPEPVVDVLPSSEVGHPEVPETEPAPPFPSSPEPIPTIQQTRDTPPPGDISSMGETSRPSRRARAAVSYAEPNLRDKMRRPTKELFDAVAGETRWKPRPSLPNSEEPPSAGPTTKKPSSTASEGKDASKGAPQLIPSTSEALASAGVASPLAEKRAKLDRAASTSAHVTEPRHQQSSSVSKSAVDSKDEGSGESPKPQNSPEAPSNDEASSPSDPAIDPYEFPSSTPASDKFDVTIGKDKGRPPPRRKSKSSRRLSSLNSEDFDVNNATHVDGLNPAAAARKRTSLARSRSTARIGADDDPEDLGLWEVKDVESRSSSRRRSMML